MNSIFLQSAFKGTFTQKYNVHSKNESNLNFKYSFKSFSTEAAGTEVAAKPKLTQRPYKQQISRTKIIRDRVNNWMKQLELNNRVETQNRELKSMYAKRLEWHRRITEHEETRKQRLEDKKQFLKKWEYMEKNLQKTKDERIQHREEMFKKKKELYTKAKKEFLSALEDDEDAWEDHPDELVDARYHIVRENRAYYTKYN